MYFRFQALPIISNDQVTLYLFDTCLPTLSGLIRHFVLHNLCDLNPTNWVALVAQFLELLPLKQEVMGLNPA